MKKLALVLLLVLPAFAFAQNNNRTSAIMTFNDGQKYMQAGDDAKALSTFKKAATYIDKAAAHEKTKGDAKTLYYMGDIYMAISGLEAKAGNNEGAMLANGKAVEGYQRCMEAKSSKSHGEFAPKVTQKLAFMGNMSLNQGVAFFNEKNYDGAIGMFKSAVEVSAVLGVEDSLARYNWGLAAERSENWDVAIEQYEKCAETGYKGAQMYNFLAYVHSQKGDNAGQLAAVQAGRAKYPDDANLIISELNFYLRDGKFAEAEKNLLLAIEKDPTNKVLHFSLGSVYDNLRGGEEEPVKKNDLFIKAEGAYLKALNIDAEYFDANYNLGALYYNQGVEANNALDPEMKIDAYKKAKAAIDAIFAQSVPYLEKARVLKPDDQNTLASLQQVYARTGQNDKYNEVKAALESLKNG